MEETDQIIDGAVSVKDGIYRYAYPAYRVYVFGKDVTSDVVEVRPSQSGGSAERTPGSCSLTLVNANDNYILTYEDMLNIGRAKNEFKQYAQQKIQEWKDDYSSKVNKREIAEILDLDLEYDTMTNEYYEDPDAFPSTKRDYVEDLEAIKQRHAGLKEKISNMFLSDWTDMFPGEIKANVLQEKLSSTYISSEIDKDTNLLTYETGEVGDYPVQQGDCIFHPNDPVRVAFRDPFNPKRWYWVFTGFVDSFTEDTNENLESYVNLTCTDVTKMMRYSLIQMSTGILDPNVEEIIQQAKEITANTSYVPYQEFFAHFTILEVLEALFFGDASLDKILKVSTMNQLSNMTESEVRTFLMNSVGMSKKEVDEMFLGWDPGSPSKIIFDKLYGLKAARIKNGDLPPVAQPAPYFKPSSEEGGVVTFQRQGNRQGTYAYYYGEPDSLDQALGEQVPKLKYWNDEIYHKVTVDDLERMLCEGETPVQNASAFTIEWIIDEIGRHPTKYPVGGGRVYYMAPAKLGTLGRNLIDKSLGGAASMHSAFRDRLSFVYDLAENIDARFYATPKGDMVFEALQMYDFDPEDFWDADEIPMTDIEKEQEQEEAWLDVLAENLGGWLDDVGLSSEAGRKYLVEKQGYSEKFVEKVFEIKEGREYRNQGIYPEYYKPSRYDYERIFSILDHELYSYSTSASDEGVLTAYRATPATVGGYGSLNNENLEKNQWAYNKDHMRMLGLRVGTGATWGFIDTNEGAELYSALMLRRVNAEARRMEARTIPKFGLMVNRPVYWQKKNYSATIVSLQHSISWASSCETNINLNQIRGWTGKIENGKPYREHFGGRQPFNIARILKQSQQGTKDEK